ncbi:hypothetical protein HanPI659440_Chr09g0336711 [Helianthus annuus]|nr:hypothetical protein HanPI659440_Chr09g0336711 [Helianthus annuus]
MEALALQTCSTANEMKIYFLKYLSQLVVVMSLTISFSSPSDVSTIGCAVTLHLP